MDSVIRAKYEQRAKIIKALAHPTRLFIVDELGKGERCVCELTEMVGVDVSTISKHLSLMKAAGLLEDRKAGLQVYYRLRTPCILNVFNCVEGVLEQSDKTEKTVCGQGQCVD